MAEMHETIELPLVHEVPLVTSPLVEDGPITTNIGIPGLWLVGPDDKDRLLRLLDQAWRIEEIWDDDARKNRGQWFMNHYTNPFAMLFDVQNGGGLVAFIRTLVGWRAQVYAAAWSRRAMGRDDLFMAACKLMMMTHDLLVIDSFVKVDNRRSQKATLRAGFRNRGIIRRAACYNGEWKPMFWNELDRRDAGLDQGD